jgi:oxygen-independent coproporphyrinogen-3 oxidase
MDHQLIFDAELIRRYDKAGPRYTSYPTAVQFRESFGEAEYRVAALASNAGGAPLSLYFHLPFCDTVCYYCACNKIVTRNRQRTAPYLERLFREIELQGELFDRSRPVDQLHWGGGTPTFLSAGEMRALMRKTRAHFRLHDDDSGEYSIEVDPREANAEIIALLRELGFNRLSLGVQDFDPTVQKAVNRIQSEAETFAVLDAARQTGFRSVNLDLIYGLPHQTVASFAATLDKVIAAAPDRLSVFNYAHLPELFKTQRQIDAASLPAAGEKLAILQYTIERLNAAGYVYIGMDHFAHPDDELAVAQREGSLYRNFQGYSTHADCDLVAMGITAIGALQGSSGAAGAGSADAAKGISCYSQNVKTLDEYSAALDAGHLPVYRGVVLSADDRLRRAIITQLICHFELNFGRIEQAFTIRFRDYFAAELQELTALQADGLLELREDCIVVRPVGKLLIRNICMVFDAYLRVAQQQQFSKVI